MEPVLLQRRKYCGAVSIALKWFSDKRGLAAGLITAAYGSGAALFNPLSEPWVDVFSAFSFISLMQWASYAYSPSLVNTFTKFLPRPSGRQDHDSEEFRKGDILTMQANRKTIVTFGASLSALALIAALTGGAIRADERGGGPIFNTPGNILIADQFNNRVIEIDPKTHNVVWTFGDGSSTPGPTSVVGTNDAERVGNLTLIAGTGAPGGTEPTCPAPNGCPDNRVMLVDQQGKIVWQYGKAGVTGAGPDQLNTPVQNTFLPNGNIMITDQGNQRVIVVTQAKQIVWQYGQTGVSGIGFNLLNNPNSAELLPDGHVLIADENNNRVIEVAPVTHEVVWQYPTTLDPTLLSGAAFASRLPDGNTLITDSNNNRVIEVTKTGTVVFSYSTLDPAGNPNPLPTRAIRVRDGLTLISDQFNDRVIAVTQAGQIVFTQGMLNVPGNEFNQLNAPYDAKVIGQYFGLTPP